MINIQEAKEIINKTTLTDIEQLSVIQRYIFDKKNIKVDLNRPSDFFNLQLMDIAFNAACEYYANI